MQNNTVFYSTELPPVCYYQTILTRHSIIRFSGKRPLSSQHFDSFVLKCNVLGETNQSIRNITINYLDFRGHFCSRSFYRLPTLCGLVSTSITCVSLLIGRTSVIDVHGRRRRRREGGDGQNHRRTRERERGGTERCRGSMGAEISHRGDGGMDG